MSLGLLYVFLGEVSVQVLCPFFNWATQFILDNSNLYQIGPDAVSESASLVLHPLILVYSLGPSAQVSFIKSSAIRAGGHQGRFLILSSLSFFWCHFHMHQTWPESSAACICLLFIVFYSYFPARLGCLFWKIRWTLSSQEGKDGGKGVLYRYDEWRTHGHTH